MKERLIELFSKFHFVCVQGCGRKYEDADNCNKCAYGQLADYLLKNGVIVPPCKVGDKAYYITGIHNTLIKECRIVEIYIGECSFVYLVNSDYLNFELQECEIYFTKEEAEHKLRKEDENADR